MIEAFFSWIEHLFIHIAILNGVCSTGKELSHLTGADWAEKFKFALDFDEPETKVLFDELTLVRRQLRYKVSHGAFGKGGQVFRFHSNAAQPHYSFHTSGIESRFALVLGPSFIRHRLSKLLHASNLISGAGGELG